MLDIGAVVKAVPPSLWCLLVFLAALKLFMLWWNSPTKKGKRGEALVAARLRAGLPEEYRILNDIYLPLLDGTTAQIDHIVVSKYGVFVVETKTYSGWIFGNRNDPQWTQTFRSKKKSRFQNPIRQNYEHICVLAENLKNLNVDKSCFRSVVVFNGGCEFKTDMPEEVVFSRRAAEYIRSIDRPVISAAMVDEIVSRIVELDAEVGDERKANHVANLRKRHSRHS